MKKILIILCLFLTACAKTNEPIIKNTHKYEMPTETPNDNMPIEKNQETAFVTDSETQNTKDIPSLIHNEAEQIAYDIIEEMISSRYDKAVFTAAYANQQVQFQSFDSKQITSFFNILKKSKIISLSGSRNIKKEDLKIDVIASNSLNQHIHCQFIFNQEEPLLLLLDSTNEYQITLDRSVYDTMFDYLTFLNMGTKVPANEAETYEHQFINENDITRDYNKRDYLLKAADTSEGLIQKSFADTYGWNTNDLNRILSLIFYTGEYSSAPEFNEDIFRFIMLNNEFMDIVGGDVERLSEVTYKQNGVEETVQLDTAIPGYSILMSGKDFRAAYQSLFNTEMKWDESKSYHYDSQTGEPYGYFADHDLYYFSRYCIGAIGGYSGWNLLIENKQETENVITLELLNFYTTYTWIDDEYFIMLYDKDWQQVSAEEINWYDDALLNEQILPLRDRCQQWVVKLLQREDGSFALLSAECINNELDRENDLPYIEIVMKPRANTMPQDCYLMPQFTLLGKDAFLINADISAYADANRGFIVEEDEYQIIIKSMNRYLLPFKDEYLYYAEQTYTYDKQLNTFINAEKILARKRYY